MATLAVGALYLVSHALRAARLAALSVSVLGVSGRSAAALHFTTAPFSLVMPLKSGELVRFYALWKASGDALQAVAVLLIDRMYDSLFLVPLLVVLMMQDTVPSSLGLFTLVAAVVPLVVVVLGPRLLTEAQRYVVSNHVNPRAISVLRRIDAMRRLVIRIAQVSRRQAAELSVLSALIWLCEIGLCAILLSELSAHGDGSVEVLGARLVTSWWTASPEPVAAVALAVTTIAILVPWPIMGAIFFSRIEGEPRRRPIRDRIEDRL